MLDVNSSFLTVLDFRVLVLCRPCMHASAALRRQGAAFSVQGLGFRIGGLKRKDIGVSTSRAPTENRNTLSLTVNG